MKTLQEIKDELAVHSGFRDFYEYYKNLIDISAESDTIFQLHTFMTEVAKRYAEHAIDKAAEVAKVSVHNGYEEEDDDRYFDNCSNPIVSYCIEPSKESILSVKKELK